MIVLSEQILKRIKRQGFNQDVNGKCLICSDAFQTCSHGMGEINQIIWQAKIAIGLKGINAK